MKKIFKALAISAASVAMVAGIATATACSAGYNGTYTGGYSYTSKYGQTYGMMVEVTVENNIITSVKDITNTEDALKNQGGYTGGWGQPYTYKESGIEWHTVSAGWSSYFLSSATRLLYTTKDAEMKGVTECVGTDGNKVAVDAESYYYKITDKKTETTVFYKWDEESVVNIDYTKGGYGWTDANEEGWTNHVSWLTQQYVGWSVADILDISVYTDYAYAPDASGNQLVPNNSISGEPYEVKYNDGLNSSGLLITGATQGSGRLLLAVQNALLGK